MNWYLTVLKKYAVFKGRARRKEYWMFFLINLIICLILGIIQGIMEMNSTFHHSLLADAYSLAVFIPSVAVGVRRIHDLGKGGWFILIPIYNLILFVTNGNQGENKYGPDPKAAV